MTTPPAPANPPAGSIYCTVCMVQYAQGGAAPQIAIMWLTTVWFVGLLPVCYMHGVQGYQPNQGSRNA